VTADDTLLTLSEAAEQCGVARSTIRRALDQDRFPNAVRDDDARGTWWVPVSDLLDAGYVPATPQSTPQVPEQSTPQGTHLVPWADVAQLVDRLADLQDARATAERDAAVAAFRQQQAETERDRVTAELSEARAAAQAAAERAAAAEQARVLAEAERTRLQAEADSRRRWGRRT